MFSQDDCDVNEKGLMNGKFTFKTLPDGLVDRIAFYFPQWFEVLNKHLHKASIFALFYVVKSIQNMKKIHECTFRTEKNVPKKLRLICHESFDSPSLITMKLIKL